MQIKKLKEALEEWKKTKSIKLASTICEQLAEDFAIEEDK